MLEMNARMAKLENDLATGYSRMVPELIPDRYGHLRLVDAFACNPDESCGQATT
jgi:hypothetical protein